MDHAYPLKLFPALNLPVNSSPFFRARFNLQVEFWKDTYDKIQYSVIEIKSSQS